MSSTSPKISRGVPASAPADTPFDDRRRCLRVDAGPHGGAVDVAELAGHRIAVGDRLVCDLFPVAAAGDRYAATAMTVDVAFDDGTTAGAAGACDQYGTALDPAAQADAKRFWVDQWNRRTVDLSAFAGRRVSGIRLIVGPGAETRTVFVEPPVVVRAPERPAEMLGWVDTRRGTRGSDRFSRGNTAPIVTLPHGGVFALPMTDASAGNWPYRWQADAPCIEAFATSHIPSPWIGDRGVFQLMPSPEARPARDRRKRARSFDRESEHAGPHEYRVELDGVSVLLTAARHAVGMRFRSRGETLSVVVDHLGEAVDASWAHRDGALHLDVHLRDGGDRPDHYVHAVLPGAAGHDLRLRGGALGGVIRFSGRATDAIVGVSTIDAEQAVRNARDAGGIDTMRERAATAWRRVLGRVEIPDAAEVGDDTMRSIAGSLARVFSYPNAHDEPTPDGPRYRSPVDGVVRAGPYASNNGFWDTYRTAWPLLGLLTPATAGALADGFVQHFTDAGWVARWSAPGPVDSMTGTTSDTVFAGLAALGVPLRTDEAYRSALRHATVPAADARVGRKGLRPGIFRGYIDTATHEGMSWTLDNAINDAAAARLAQTLLEATTDAAERDRLEAEREYLSRRALGYRAVFRRGLHEVSGRPLGFFVGRRPDGSWRVGPEAFDPAEWGHDYTETNAWGTMFTAPHDGAGLADLHGGEEGLAAALAAFFATPETADPALVGSYGFVIHEMSEARDVRMGMLGLSNQPAHHIPLTACFAGRHDDAHRIVVEARDRLFAGSDLGQGYPGDEDNGEMSAWYLFAVLGLYPLVPGSGEFVLTPPLLPRVVLHPEGRERPLEIVAVGAGAPYIREVRIDGRPWHQIAVPAEVILTADRIEMVLSEDPTGWAAASRPSSFSIEAGVDPLVDLLETRPGSVADDAGAAPVELAPGDRIELPLAEPGRVGLYAVTPAGEPVPLPAPVAGESTVTASWRLEARTVAGEWIELDARSDEVFEVAAQTRPFLTTAGRDAAITAVRFCAVSALRLAQLEVFAPPR
ncbi:glycoside hydrolase domain-containing protein [Microbacterium imperiale]|uniref:glycoside hydrolase domain-containing protein n=3 Tax=Microbacterium imperiale TaxID=33884 RepID=UPI001AE29C36|nr:glycoside hydrolase domain-containing protein [Microbacterium imperiale]MBP2420504.1 putative alpha-1,2-mannosidase [Microbacterium imperiale]MDS0200550.1 glycoside hydrolase family 92 protein [Microbacterium imperiale]BFE40845.1 GH92 family glycosyl hydrolase [Microbacterium imperiale]